MLILLYLLLWLLFTGTAIFASQNVTLVQVQLLNLTSIKIPLGLVLVGSAATGAIAMGIWQSRHTPPTSTTKQSKYPDEEYYEDDFDDEPIDDWD